MTPDKNGVIHVEEDVTPPPMSTIIEGFICHRLDRDKSRKYIKKLCKSSGAKVARMIGGLPVKIDNEVERNALEAVDKDGNCVIRFNLKNHGPVFL